MLEHLHRHVQAFRQHLPRALDASLPHCIHAVVRSLGSTRSVLAHAASLPACEGCRMRTGTAFKSKRRPEHVASKALQASPRPRAAHCMTSPLKPLGRMRACFPRFAHPVAPLPRALGRALAWRHYPSHRAKQRHERTAGQEPSATLAAPCAAPSIRALRRIVAPRLSRSAVDAPVIARIACFRAVA